MSEHMDEESTVDQGPEQPVEEPQEAAEPTDETPRDAEPVGETEGKPGQTPGQAWDEVVEQVGELGQALSAWARAAADTPENRRHFEEVRNGFTQVARETSDAFSQAAGGDLGRSVSESANTIGQAIGDSAAEFGQAAAPHIANAFAVIAEAFGTAAQKMGEAAAPADAERPTREAPEPPRREAVDAQDAEEPGLDPDEAD